MGEPNRSLKRSTAPILKLVTPNKKSHVVGVKVMCACSDMKERQVLMDEKLSKAVLGFIAHRQGGTLQLSEGTPLRFEIQHQPPAPVSEEKGDGIMSPPCSFIKGNGEVCGLQPHEHTNPQLHSYHE